MNGRTTVFLFNFYRRMNSRGCCTTNQQRQTEAFPFQLGGHVHHFIQTRGNQSGNTDDVGFFITHSLQDFLTRDHDSQVNNAVTVAAQDHPNNIFPDIMYIALGGRNHDSPRIFPGFFFGV